MANIAIQTAYDDPQGQFLEYDSYDAAQRAQLRKQRHVNIRTFEGAGVQSPVTMIDVDVDNITVLEGLRMSQIDGLDASSNPVYSVFRSSGESWSAGTQQKLSSYHYWRALSLSVTSGDNLTQSVDTARTVDLLTDFDDNDFISISLPSYPLASSVLASSYVEFTSDPGGVFNGTDRIPFTANLNSWIAGNMEFRFKRQLVYASLVGQARTNALKSVTGIKFNFRASGSNTVLVMAIRLLSKDWNYAPLDIDTRLQRLALTPPLAQPDPAPYTFPTGTVTSVPTDFPPLFWADTPPGNTDPRPIDGGYGIAFNTGTTGVSVPDSRISLYLREVQSATLTQLDLEMGYSMATLDAFGRQPDYTTPGWVERSRTQAELDPLVQDDLNNDIQFTLDAIPDYQVASWLEVNLGWHLNTATVTLSDNNEAGYALPTFTIKPNQDYYMVVHIEDTEIRVRVYEMDTNTGNIANTTTGEVLQSRRVFNSGTVSDLWIRRRPGRVGYYAQFGAGDSCIYQIMPRGLNFAEYRTKALTSVTPVRGAQIFYGGAPDRQLFLNWNPGPLGGRFVSDNTKSRSGESIRIVDDGQANLQGVQSNKFFLDDYRNTKIEFDINLPSDAGLQVFLYGEFGRIVPLQLPALAADKWQHIEIDLTPVSSYQTGTYTLVVLLAGAGRITNWYLDNPSILSKTLTFAARGRRNDAWNDYPEDWTDFGTDQVNNTQGGVLFGARERTLQARAKALRQDGYIDNIRVVPIYAELGRFVWSDQVVNNPTPPSVALTMVGTTVAAATTSGATTIQVASTTNFPASGKVRIGSEIISYTGLGHGPESLTGCTRGLEGTTAASYTTQAVWPDPFLFLASGTPAPGEVVTSYEWSFGDGTTAFGDTVTHLYEQSGTYTVNVTVLDSGNHRADTNLIFTF